MEYTIYVTGYDYTYETVCAPDWLEKMITCYKQNTYTDILIEVYTGDQLQRWLHGDMIRIGNHGIHPVITNKDMIARSVYLSRMICAASRDMWSGFWPVVYGHCVSFYAGDTRFPVVAETMFYIEQYLRDSNVPFATAITDRQHVRELIEIITS